MRQSLAALAAVAVALFPGVALSQSPTSMPSQLSFSQQVAEQETLSWSAREHLGEWAAGAPRLHALGLPPGASWDMTARSLSFTPDFIQGGRQWQVHIVRPDRPEAATLTIVVDDTIAPPPPEVVGIERRGDYQILRLHQRTDAFLDDTDHAGRVIEAVATVPAGAEVEGAALPVQIDLHGFQGFLRTDGSSRQFALYPHDPDDTYWWGYQVDGAVPDYTQRRILHLLEWLLSTYPAADPDRTYITGNSMGGAGSATLGLRSARHFAYVRADRGQTIPRNHRPYRLRQLQRIWGPADPGSTWDEMDLTGVLRDSVEARDQFISLYHGKDDTIIHFGAAVDPSPLTELSFYATLQLLNVGHYGVWDEGGHVDPDPVLGADWWDAGWHPVHDPIANLRRDQAFPAFARCSADPPHGDGNGNGTLERHPSRAYAGDDDVPGDTGWAGLPFGVVNRYLRWDARGLIDTHDRFELPLAVIQGSGDEPPREGYPSTGDRFEGDLPVVVDVTPRRVQGFQLAPGEVIGWRFGDLSGEVVADDQGVVTVPRLPLTHDWVTLTLARVTG